MFLMKLMKFSFAICYISVNVMAVVAVFRFEDVSRATISAFGSSSSSSASSSSKILPSIPMLLPVAEAFAPQQVNQGRHHQRLHRSRQQQQQNLFIGAGRLFLGSQDNDATMTNRKKRGGTISNNKRLLQDLKKQHLEMSRMIEQQKENTIPSSTSSSPVLNISSSTTTTTATSSSSSSTSKLLHRYGTSSPILNILPKSKKEAADGAVDFLIKYIL